MFPDTVTELAEETNNHIKNTLFADLHHEIYGKVGRLRMK